MFYVISFSIQQYTIITENISLHLLVRNLFQKKNDFNIIQIEDIVSSKYI